MGLSPEPERGSGGGRGSSAPPCRVCALLGTSSHPVGENTAPGARRRTKGLPPLIPAQQLGSVLLSPVPLLLCFCPRSFRRLQGPAAAFPLGSVPAAAGKAREAPLAQLRGREGSLCPELLGQDVPELGHRIRSEHKIGVAYNVRVNPV